MDTARPKDRKLFELTAEKLSRTLDIPFRLLRLAFGQ